MSTPRVSPRHKLSTFEPPTVTENGLLVLVHYNRDSHEHVAWCPHLELSSYGKSFSAACHHMAEAAREKLGNPPEEGFDFRFENFGA